jgi:putative nucleotidyltransferase with HDIG domain
MVQMRVDRLTPDAVALLGVLLDVGGRARGAVLVGGAVRDAVAGRRRAGVDVDVTVERDALGLARRVADRVAGAFVELDAERGAGRIVTASGRLDVTDLRAPTLDADLASRDFTVNALAVRLDALIGVGRAPILDPTGGVRDIAARRLRPPDARVLDDDPLRGVRGVRLEAELGFRLTPSAVRAIRARASALVRVSAERVRDELLAMLRVSCTARAVRRLDALRLLGVILPEIEPMRRTRQPAPHRFSVLEHSLRALAGADRVLARLHALAPYGEELEVHVAEPLGGGVDRGMVLKLAAFLHDVSKPETRREIDGRIRFFEHDVRGAERVRAIGDRLRLPDRATRVLERLVRQHLRPMHLAQSGEVTPRARYRFLRDLGADARDLLLLALVDAAAVTGASPFVAWRRAFLIHDLMAGWQDAQDAVSAPPLVTGNDVMHRFGLEPGPRVGDLLRRAREAQDLGLVRTREEALAFLDSPPDGPYSSGNLP